MFALAFRMSIGHTEVAPTSDVCGDHAMRRFVRGMTFLGVLALIPLGYYLYRASADADRLQALLADLDHNEPGWRFAERQARIPVLPDEANSALLIARLKLPAPRTLDALSVIAPNMVLTPIEAAKVKAYLESVEVKLGEARRVADLPDGRFPLTIADDFISTLLPHVQQVREFCFALRAAAVWQAQHGNLEQAVQDVQASVHAARTLRHEPFLVSHLVRLAALNEACATMERLVAQGHPSAKLLESAQTLFSKEQVVDGWFDAMAGERAGMHELFERIAQGKVDPASIRGWMGFRRRWHDSISDHFTALSARASHIWMLEHFTAKLATRELPAKERRQRIAELREEAALAPALARELLVPPFRDTYDPPLRVQAKLNATVAGLAAERYRLKHQRWPKTLDELVPEFLDSVPVDPYDDEPLRYRATRDGVVVYSAGPDGAFTGDARDGPVAPDTPSDLPAHEFRLWNVDKRRQ